MSFSKWIFISGFLFIILYLVSKKGTVLSKVLFVLAIFAFLGSFYLPGVIFGTWNSIKSLKGKEVHNIFLQPSIPDWPANLTDSLTVISDTSQIAYILDLLKKTEAYFPNHPIPIWETNMILITKENDSLSLRISKTENNGTVIYSPDNELRKDELGSYLEKVTNFSKPSVMKK
jgi:hypothetical protein